MAESTALDSVIEHYIGDDHFAVAEGIDCLSEPAELFRSAFIAATSGKPRQLAHVLRLAAESGFALASDPDTYRWGCTFNDRSTFKPCQQSMDHSRGCPCDR